MIEKASLAYEEGEKSILSLLSLDKSATCHISFLSLFTFNDAKSEFH